MSWYETMLAEVEINKSNVEAAIEILQKSLKRCLGRNEYWSVSMLKPKLAVALYKREKKILPEIEEFFLSAISIAQDHKTRWLELNATADYCQVLSDDGQKQKARALLSPLLAELSEGHSTPRYTKAKELLAILS